MKKKWITITAFLLALLSLATLGAGCAGQPNTAGIQPSVAQANTSESWGIQADGQASLTDGETGDAQNIMLLSATTTSTSLAETVLTSLCDAAKEKLGSIVGKKAASIFDSVLSIFGINLDDSSEELKMLQDISDQLNDMSVQIDNVAKDVKKLIEATETSAFKQQMRDVQSSVLTLKPRITGYLGGFEALIQLEPGTEEYNNELKSLADSINEARGIDFHAETYALGEKLLSDAAGTSDGALKAHYDRVMTQNNWEQQTYDERERFYLYTVGTYYQAAVFDQLALAYTIETAASSVTKKEAQSQLNELNTQIEKVAALAEKYQIKRLKPEYDRNLRTGIILSTSVETVTYDANNRLVSNAEAYRLIQQKLLDDTPAGKSTSLVGNGTFTLPESLGLLTEEQAQGIMKYSSANSLVEELRSAGFSIPEGCPDAVILRDVRIQKDGTRTGTSGTRSTIYVYYKTFEKSATDTLFSDMSFAIHKFVWKPDSRDTDPDINKATKYRESSWRTNSLTVAAVKQIADAESLYLN